MLISVRLDPEAERTLSQLARKTGKTKSELIRQAIRELGKSLGSTATGSTVYERFSDVIGIVNLGPGRRAARAEEILRKMLATKGGRR
ncbi:MAG: ribbon-helix-helix protein, CopG family [Armatimonadota bacterium]|nr:ribbon-helix-helix protein, CopG family [Armatimonadota bacterium]MDR5703737.1 ribbon-helix-helix protein, CopG family [Armatimonadota bacterium]